MPLTQGSSKKTVSKNISELMKGKPSAARAKGIKTLAKKQGISPAKAKQKQAIAIAMNIARKKAPGKYPIPNKY
ncbi:MAG: hypothetical protein NTY61_02275 [Candidatus Parcubacteria bacterium]|nr:hypothetical protein [Candidatus Parcubacteria bacterium]